MPQPFRRPRSLRVAAVALLILAPLSLPPLASRAAAKPSATSCHFVLGFALLRHLIGPSTVGTCLGNTRYQDDEDVGVLAVQRTTRGRLSWQQADNLMTFNDGTRTWTYDRTGLHQSWNALTALHDALVPDVRCGKVRWPIKTLEDSPTLNYLAQPTTIAALATVARPADYRKFALFRYTPLETTIFTVTANLSKVIREADSDYHLILADTLGNQMVAEFPHEACITNSPIGLQALMDVARGKLESACGLAPTPAIVSGDGEGEETAITLHGSATIVGVGYYDFVHNSTGQLPNFVELHPVLYIPQIVCSRM
jgi:hypothetical protein